MLTPTLLCVLAYLIGSIPSGYLLIRAIRNVDVRHYGSHSIGATNVCHVGGIWLGLLTLLADAGKALGVVLLAGAAGSSPSTIACAAIAVMVGHAYSFWLLLSEGRFSEGKSVACALGVVVGLCLIRAFPWYLAAAPVGVWLLGLIAPRVLTGRWCYISPATMAAAISLPLVAAVGQLAAVYLALTASMALLILARHKNNIKRLLAGREPRLGERLSRRPASAAGSRDIRSRRAA